MSVALVADAHLGGPGGPAGPLVEQLLELPGKGCERLLLLGDLFHVWVGAPRYETPEVREVLAAVRRLGEQGVRVDYVEGNRDFFVAGGPYASAFRTVAREIAFESGGVRYLAVHGDGVNRRDWRYLLWRRLSKSVPMRLLLTRTVPRRFASRLVYRTEARLARTNLEHKRGDLPEALIRAWGEGRLAEGHDVLLLGHFHEAHRWPVAGGEVRLVDAWFRNRRVEWAAPPMSRPPVGA